MAALDSVAGGVKPTVWLPYERPATERGQIGRENKTHCTYSSTKSFYLDESQSSAISGLYTTYVIVLSQTDRCMQFIPGRHNRNSRALAPQVCFITEQRL